MAFMANVTVRELRNRGGQVLDRVERGEQITVTRDGREVAELRAVRKAIPASTLVDRYRRLPTLDPAGLRQDLDEILDSEV